MSGDSFAELAKSFKKQYGDHAAVSGDTIMEAPRAPTGIFPLDLATGGGIPRGRVTELFGLESTCKSNVLYKTIGMNQKLHPEEKNALVDIEHAYTPMWGSRMGIDPASLLVLNPDYGEQAVDMIEGLIASPECGIVGLDSLAAAVTEREAENSAEKADPGGQAQVGKKLTNKVVLAQRKAEGDGLTPTFIYINQLKYKIGVMYGDPATTPGGNSPRFAAALRLRFFAKDIKDDKYSTTHAARKEIRIVVIKHKVPIVARECIFEMAMIPHAGMMPGDIDDWKTVWYYLQSHGLATESGKGWEVAGKQYQTQKSIKEMLAEDLETAHMIRTAIINAEVDKAYNEQHQGKAKDAK